MFQADTTVREVLTNYPGTFSVFGSHGMCESCAASPPPVPLHHFAERHGVELDELIAQLTERATASTS